MAITQNDGLLAEAIIHAVKHRAEKIVAEESAKAAEQVRKRLEGVADEAALSVLALYDMRRDAERVIITVNKEKESTTR